MTYLALSQRQQTRMLINRTRCALQYQEAARYRVTAVDLFLATWTGAMLGWLVAGAGLI